MKNTPVGWSSKFLYILASLYNLLAFWIAIVIWNSPEDSENMDATKICKIFEIQILSDITALSVSKIILTWVYHCESHISICSYVIFFWIMGNTHFLNYSKIITLFTTYCESLIIPVINSSTTTELPRPFISQIKFDFFQ